MCTELWSFRNLMPLMILITLVTSIIGCLIAHQLVYHRALLSALGTLAWTTINNIFQRHYMLAPVCWLLTLVTIVVGPRWLPPPPPDPDPPHYSRRVLRQAATNWRRHHRRNRKSRPPSIRTHGLHRRYPLHLRGLQHRPTCQPSHTMKRRTGLYGLHGQQPVTSHHARTDNLQRREENHWQYNAQQQRRKHSAVRRMAEVQLYCVPTNPQSNLLRMAMQAPSRFHNTMPKESTFPIIWDSGASVSITFDKADFLDYQVPPVMLRLRGLAKGLHIAGTGTIAWTMQDTNGILRTLKLPAYHVPACPARLLST
jgi:hypothetical protein